MVKAAAEAEAEAEAESGAVGRRGLLAAAAAVVAIGLAPSADAKVAPKAPDPYEVSILHVKC